MTDFVMPSLRTWNPAPWSSGGSLQVEKSAAATSWPSSRRRKGRSRSRSSRTASSRRSAFRSAARCPWVRCWRLAGGAGPSAAPARARGRSSGRAIAPSPLVPAAPTLGERHAVSPAARRRAAELGVGLSGLRGTGVGGAVCLADIERAAAGRPAAAHRGGFDPAAMRAAIAAAMSRSNARSRTTSLGHTCDLTRAVTWLEQVNAGRLAPERAASSPPCCSRLPPVRSPSYRSSMASGSTAPSSRALRPCRLGIALRGRRASGTRHPRRGPQDARRAGWLRCAT